jgi:class 3 adenylate cyclase
VTRSLDIQYARASDGAYLAYQVFGDGPIDIAWLFADFGNIDIEWETAYDRVWYEGLGSFARVILHDRRSVGLSSRDRPAPDLETRMADLVAVLDAAGAERPVLGGWLEGLAPAILLAASQPGRVRALVWDEPSPRTIWAPDYPWGWKPETVDAELAALALWGTRAYGEAWADQIAAETGSRPDDESITSMARSSRNTCTPDVALELQKIWWETDIRDVLPAVQAPTLLLTTDRGFKQGLAEHIASLMPRATVERHSEGWNAGAVTARLGSIRRHIGVEAEPLGLDRVLTTVLFTDIVGSTGMATAVGDQRWKELLAAHDEAAKKEITRHHGTYIHTTGDGLLATFDGPARAVRCANALTEVMHALGIEIRCGVHTGEVEMRGDDVAGVAVHIGARVAALAAPSQVLVSSTVKDLTAGSGLAFVEAGEHELKGVPDRWHLYAVH